MTLFWIGLGGAAGAISRYLMTIWISGIWARSFPLATLLVNLVGALLIGVLFGLLQQKTDLAPQLKPLLMVGFLGGFTTFSTFSLETYQLILRGELTSALLYALASVILCVLAVVLGIWCARLF